MWTIKLKIHTGAHEACRWLGWGPHLLRTLGLTMTLLVTVRSRCSGGTSSSRAAVWISAQLDTAATSWDSRWTEEGELCCGQPLSSGTLLCPQAALLPKGRSGQVSRLGVWGSECMS